MSGVNEYVKCFSRQDFLNRLQNVKLFRTNRTLFKLVSEMVKECGLEPPADIRSNEWRKVYKVLRALLGSGTQKPSKDAVPADGGHLTVITPATALYLSIKNASGGSSVHEIMYSIIEEYMGERNAYLLFYPVTTDYYNKQLRMLAKILDGNTEVCNSTFQKLLCSNTQFLPADRTRDCLKKVMALCSGGE